MRPLRLGQLVLAISAIVVPMIAIASPAQAATCQYFASAGIKVCGDWNSTIEYHSDVEYAKTSSWTWSVTRLDSTIRITSVKVRTGGFSSCSAHWSGCSVIKLSPKQVSRATTGTVNTLPEWGTGKWGQIDGAYNFQMSNLQITWCHGTTCKTETTSNIGGGQVEVPNLMS